MVERSPFAARLVRAGAPAYAARAVARWFETDSEVEARYAPGAFEAWRAELARGLEELAAALADGVPELFGRRAAWSSEAFAARELPAQDFAAALEHLRAVLAEELPAAAAAVVEPYFEAAQASLTQARQPASSSIDEASPAGRLTREYVAALSEGDSRRACQLLLEAQASGALDTPTLLIDVLCAAQREVGRGWHRGELTVGEEHFATATTRRALHVLLGATEVAAPAGKCALVGVAAGDLHDLAAEVVAALLELDGWRVVFLGPDVPGAELPGLVDRHGAQLVVLSATIETQRRQAAAAIATLRGSGQDVAVMVGGAAFAGHPSLWRNSGADGWADDAREALRRARELVGLPAR